MGPLPKRRVSKARRDRRRTHDVLSLKHLVPCPNCGEFKVSHQVCPSCGTYNGRKVIEVEEKED